MIQYSFDHSTFTECEWWKSDKLAMFTQLMDKFLEQLKEYVEISSMIPKTELEILKRNAVNHILRNHISASWGQIYQLNVVSKMLYALSL